MLISIIIPCYNAEKTVKRTLDSLLEQDYNDYEIIVVNDGSTDSTHSILNSYQDIYPQVRLIDKLNGGVSSARNRGLEVAIGDYIYFLDSDDYVKEGFFKLLVDIIKKTDSPIIAFGFEWQRKGKNVIPHSKGTRYFKKFLLGSELINIWSYVAKRNCYKDNSINFNTKLFYAEDHDVFYRIFYIYQDKIATIKKPLLVYTDNENSAMRKPITAKNFTSFISFEGLLDFFNKKRASKFYLKAIKNKCIQNYYRLYSRCHDSLSNTEDIERLFSYYSYYKTMRPPFQLSRVFFYNLLKFYHII